jgi:hypothetical protein
LKAQSSSLLSSINPADGAFNPGRPIAPKIGKRVGKPRRGFSVGAFSTAGRQSSSTPSTPRLSARARRCDPPSHGTGSQVAGRNKQENFRRLIEIPGGDASSVPISAATAAPLVSWARQVTRAARAVFEEGAARVFFSRPFDPPRGRPLSD